MEFDLILHMHLYLEDVGREYYTSISTKFLTALWPVIDVRISFPSIY